MPFPLLIPLLLLGGAALALSTMGEPGPGPGPKKFKLRFRHKNGPTSRVAEDLLDTFSGGSLDDYPAPYSWAHTQDIAKFLLQGAKLHLIKGDDYAFRAKVYARIRASQMKPADKVLATIWYVINPLLSLGLLWYWYNEDLNTKPGKWYHAGKGVKKPSTADLKWATKFKTAQLASIINWVGTFFITPGTATAPVGMKANSNWKKAKPVFSGLSLAGVNSSATVALIQPVKRVDDVNELRRLITALLIETGGLPCSMWGSGSSIHAATACDNWAWIESSLPNLESWVGYNMTPEEKVIAGNLKAVQLLVSVDVIEVAKHITLPPALANAAETLAINIALVVVTVVIAVVAPYIAPAIAAAAQASGAVAGVLTAIGGQAVAVGAVQAAMGAGVTALLAEAAAVDWSDDMQKVEAGIATVEQAAKYAEERI